MIPTFMLGDVGLLGAKWDSADDPYWSSVIVLLRMTGSDGTTTLVDSGPRGMTITNDAGHAISSEQSKFDKCCKLNNGGNNFGYSNTTATELSGDFTIELWFYATSNPFSNAYFFGLLGVNQHGLMWMSGSPTARTLNYYDGAFRYGTNAITLNAWHHIVMQRASGTVEWGLDGVSEGTRANSSTYCANGTNFNIGAADNARNGELGVTATKYIDCLRVTKGVARYTFPCTPPTSEF